MIALCVDDEYLLLRSLKEAALASPDISEVAAFEDSTDALEWAKTHPFDIAIIDIRMPVMSGLELGRALRDIHPDVPLYFCTGYKEYALKAFEIHANGYLMKPVSAAHLQKELDYLLHRGTHKTLLMVRCYGGFDVYDTEGTPLHFKRSRARELFALLVDRNGIGITAKKVCALMFRDDGVMDAKNMNYFFKLYYDLVETLEHVGAGEVLKKNGNNYYLDMSLIQIDETGKGTAAYMEDYIWTTD